MRHFENAERDKFQDKAKFVNISEEQEIQIFAKQMLAKRLFMGHYQERRYVGPLSSYRDVVRLNDSENDLKHDLEIVRRRIQGFYTNTKWIGITEPDMPGAPAGLCVWVTLSGVPLGHHWFQIREVRFSENQEICLRLKCLRPVGASNEDALPANASTSEESNSENMDQRANGVEPSESFESPLTLDISNLMNFVKNIKYNELLRDTFSKCSHLFTLHNMKEAVTFLLILVVTSLTGFLHFVKFLGEFFLKFMREVSILIQVCTPLFLGVIDFFSKCVGGLYLLIAMMWRGTPVQRPPSAGQRPLALANSPAYAHRTQPYFRPQFGQPYSRFTYSR